MVLEILNISELDSSIEFTKFEYCESGNASATNFTPLKLTRFDRDVNARDLSRMEQKEVKDLTSMQAVNQLSVDEIFSVAQRHCSVDPEVLVKGDLEKVLKELKVLDFVNVVSEIIFTLDPMQLGECVQIMCISDGR